jgi:hypothetical protein
MSACGLATACLKVAPPPPAGQTFWGQNYAAECARLLFAITATFDIRKSAISGRWSDAHSAVRDRHSRDECSCSDGLGNILAVWSE